ncbi:MAG: hypothetical protein AAGK23_08455, partial [Pseudomonadota bacterium]
LIDLSAEKARLEKEIGKLQKDIAGVDKKLANEKFMANAPPEIIEEQHTRRGDWTAKADKLAGALEQLSSLTS